MVNRLLALSASAVVFFSSTVLAEEPAADLSAPLKGVSNATAIPEPSAGVLVILGLTSLMILRWAGRSRKAAQPALKPVKPVAVKSH